MGAVGVKGHYNRRYAPWEVQKKTDYHEANGETQRFPHVHPEKGEPIKEGGYVTTRQ